MEGTCCELVIAVLNKDESYFNVQPLEVPDRREIAAFAVTPKPKSGAVAYRGDVSSWNARLQLNASFRRRS